jgi:hypothetical protein
VRITWAASYTKDDVSNERGDHCSPMGKRWYMRMIGRPWQLGVLRDYPGGVGVERTGESRGARGKFNLTRLWCTCRVGSASGPLMRHGYSLRSATEGRARLALPSPPLIRLRLDCTWSTWQFLTMELQLNSSCESFPPQFLKTLSLMHLRFINCLRNEHSALNGTASSKSSGAWELTEWFQQ